MGKKAKPQTLEQGLLRSMRALDNQIARHMERSPGERETLGVQKWEPYGQKVEEMTAVVMQALGTEEIQLDSILVLSQAMSKALKLLVEDLGEEGLGKVRSQYSRLALQSIAEDARLGLLILGARAPLM